jgi:LA2681-like HEPN
MANTADLFEKLLKLSFDPAVATKDALKRIGVLVDLAGDLGRDDGTAQALAWCDELSKRKLTAAQVTLLDYFQANAWANRRRLAQSRDPDSAWQWEQPGLQEEVFFGRRAAGSVGFDKLPAFRRCQILTNLGNQLSSVGRYVDARRMWTRALALNPRFGMALGSRGYGLTRYAVSLYDPGHRDVFLFFAYQDLKAALSREARYGRHKDQAARALFAEHRDKIAAYIDIPRAKRVIKMDGHPLGKTDAERRYRRWVLQERLFLNPLNDLGPYSIAACDILSLPDFTTPLGEPPSLIGFFNQMKQEFVSARWMLYEGLHPRRVHFSDRDVTLLNTLDYPTLGLPIEQVKAAYRIAYSLLDKIAYFLNEYAKLGMSARQVYFKTIWYENGDFRKGLRAALRDSKNLPLRGLFWLSKDLFDEKLQDVMEPEAQALYVIRNQLEHSYLKVHEILLPRAVREKLDKAWLDRLAHSVQREDFEGKTLHVFRLARAGLIYLSLGMHAEERRRAATQPKGLLAPMNLPPIEERFKR